MSVVYNETLGLKSYRMCCIQAAIYQQSATGTSITGTAIAGQLVIGTSALSGATGVLATITIPTTAISVSAGVLTITGPIGNNASATGTAAKAELRNGNGATIASGLTVGTTGTDVIINSTAISSGQYVQMNTSTITHG